MAFEVESGRRPDESGRAYAYRILRKNIMTFRLAPDDVLNEGELSEQMGMSRTPIHEALILLKDEGLVDILPHRSSTVSRISIGTVKEGYFMRRTLETAMVKELAGTFSPEQMRLLKENLDAQEQVLEKNGHRLSMEFFDLDDEMHRMLYQFSHREQIWTMVHRVNSHYDRVRYLDTVVNKVDQTRMMEQHRDLYYYLLMGIPADVDIAEFFCLHLGRFLKVFPHTVAEHPDYFTD